MSGLEFHVMSMVGKDESFMGDYMIRAFGRTADGRSVCANVQGWMPRFFVLIDADKKQTLASVIGQIRAAADQLERDINYETKEVRYMDMYGYRQLKQDAFIGVFSPSQGYLKALYYKLTGSFTKLTTYEHKIDPILSFGRKIRLELGWIRLRHGTYNEVLEGRKLSRCDLEVDVRDPSSCIGLNSPDYDMVAPFRFASYDIETYSEDGSFPKPTVAKNCVFMVATVIRNLGTETFTKCVHVLGPCDDPPGEADPTLTIVRCRTERELIVEWSAFIGNSDPDVLLGYNTDKFDNVYMHERAALNGVQKQMYANLSRHKNPNLQAAMVKNVLQSKAYGRNESQRFAIPGRVGLDVLFMVLRNFKLSSYKLDNVAAEFLGDKKHDIKPQQMFDAFRNSDAATMAMVLLYCVHDCILPLRIVDKKMLFLRLQELSRATFLPLSWINDRGEQIRVISQLYRLAGEKGYLIPDNAHVRLGATSLDLHFRRLCMRRIRPEEIPVAGPPRQGAIEAFLKRKLTPIEEEEEAETDADDEVDGGDEGVRQLPAPLVVVSSSAVEGPAAVVWEDCYEGDDEEEHRKGFDGGLVMDPKPNFYKECIAVLDFASLYPSVMRAHLMDYTSIVAEERYVAPGTEQPEGAEVVTHEWTESGGERWRATFVKHSQTLMPLLLQRLFEKRKAVKALLKVEKDPAMKDVYESRQVAIKVCMNSMYGFCGATTNHIACQVLSRAVTATGRSMLMRVKDTIERDNAGSEIVYGDSVTAETPMLLRIDGTLRVMTAEQFYLFIEQHRATANDEMMSDFPYDTVFDVSYGIDANGRPSILSTSPVVCGGADDAMTAFFNDVLAKTHLACGGYTGAPTVETWDGDLWTTVRSVMRHEVPVTDPVFRIACPAGFVDLTAHHGLVSKLGGIRMSALDVHDYTSTPEGQKNNVAILTGFPPFVDGLTAEADNAGDDFTTQQLQKWARILGMCFRGARLNFQGVASIDGFRAGLRTVKLCTAFVAMFHDFGIPSAYSEGYFIYIGNPEERTLFMDYFATQIYPSTTDPAAYYVRNQKDQVREIPQTILNGTLGVRSAFLQGYEDAGKSNRDGEGCDQVYNLCNRSPVTMLGIYALYRSVGKACSVQKKRDATSEEVMHLSFRAAYKDYDEVTRTTRTTSKPPAIGKGKKNVEVAPSTRAVYDLTTDSGLFSAGVGSLIVHNTDSVFVSFDRKDLTFEQHFDLARQVADSVTKEFLPPIKLEFEKIFRGMVLFNMKKKYIGMKYESPDDGGKIATRGTVDIRRDAVPVVQSTYTDIIGFLLENSNHQTGNAQDRSLKHVVALLEALVSGKVPLDKLAVSKSMTKSIDDYGTKLNTPHVVVARKMVDRGETVHSNDRITYIVTKDRESGTSTQPYLRAEDIAYVKENGLEYDAAYYIKQLEKPMRQLLGVFCDTVALDALFKRYYGKAELARKKLRTLDQWFKAPAPPPQLGSSSSSSTARSPIQSIMSYVTGGDKKPIDSYERLARPDSWRGVWGSGGFGGNVMSLWRSVPDKMYAVEPFEEEEEEEDATEEKEDFGFSSRHLLWVIALAILLYMILQK